MKPIALIAALCAFAFNALAEGEQHPRRDWTYDRLVQQSDAVVIASPRSVKRVAEQAYLPGLIAKMADGSQSALPVIEIETVFDVATVLKGDASLSHVTLRHYALSHDQKPKYEAYVPFLVHFDTESARAYLLFLKREAGASFVPTSGQVDPSLFSVHPLNAPHVETEAQPGATDNPDDAQRLREDH